MKNALLACTVLLLMSCGSTPEAAVPPPPTPTVRIATSTAPNETTPMPADLPAARTFVIDGTQSSAEYAVNEVFLSENRPYRAVGTTNAVEGSFTVVTSGQLTGKTSTIRVDLRTLKSDSDRRDNAIHGRWLESDTYPYADFVSTDVVNVPESFSEGTPVTFDLRGTMTIRNVSAPVEWLVDGTLSGGTITGKATTQIRMSDFGFSAPNIANMIKVEDTVELRVSIVASEQK